MEGVAILTFFRRSRGRLRTNYSRMAAQPKLNLCLSSTPTAALFYALKKFELVYIPSGSHVLQTEPVCNPYLVVVFVWTKLPRKMILVHQSSSIMPDRIGKHSTFWTNVHQDNSSINMIEYA